MASKYTWYLAGEPFRPSDRGWALVADRRCDAPMKARYHRDNDYFEYDTDAEGVYGSYPDDADFLAWMPMPTYYG